ncbi:MAG TPA: DUF892 family protein [Mucilaginibacter sp.]
MLSGCICMEGRLPEPGFDQDAMRDFLIEHLNRIYCAKDKLADKLPLLAGQAGFLDLQQAIGETVEEVREQLKRLRRIFILMDTFYQPTSCLGLSGLLDEAFQAIGPRAGNRKLRDLSILFYMENIESLETASFKILGLAAKNIKNKEIGQLLKECYDEAREDTVLYRQIMSYYVEG